jgi:hypothetical protein
MSAYCRRLSVAKGIVCHLPEISHCLDVSRHWFSSSVEVISEGGSFPHFHSPFRSISFESESKLSRIEREAFQGSSLKSIHLPASVLHLDAYCLAYCESLTSISFASNSKLRRIEHSAFQGTSLRSIQFPASLEEIGKGCFFSCGALKSAAFASKSNLSLIQQSAFAESGLTSIHLPASVLVIGQSSFYSCKSLEFVTFDPDSRLERIEDNAFDLTSITEMIIPGGIISFSGSAFSSDSFELLSFSPFSTRFCVEGDMIQDICGGRSIRLFGRKSEYQLLVRLK